MASSHRSVSPPPRPPLVDSVAVVLPPPTHTPTAPPSHGKAPGRRERLAERIAGAEQVIITAAVASDVPESLAGKRWIINEGTVTLDES